jgi:hypothetical protein
MSASYGNLDRRPLRCPLEAGGSPLQAVGKPSASRGRQKASGNDVQAKHDMVSKRSRTLYSISCAPPKTSNVIKCSSLKGATERNVKTEQ